MEYYDEMTYNSICSILEKEGWIKETTFIDEKMRDITSLSSARPGETAMVIDIRCPEDNKILIRGTENGDIKNFKDAYSIRLTLMDSLKNETSQFTKIRISKGNTTEYISQPISKEQLNSSQLKLVTELKLSSFYADIGKKDNDRLYRPRKNILLQEGDHLFVCVIGETIGHKLPDVAIDMNSISFRIQADIFTSRH